jgi:hypothetical protein
MKNILKGGGVAEDSEAELEFREKNNLGLWQ